MVPVDGFCIDSTEVTNAQYAQFVASKAGDVSGQPATCSWNGSYVPTASCSLATAAAAPVTCIDWCDAYAYCAWAGKRLCGHIGGGPNTVAAGALADSDQWYRACSHAGEHKFPYGDTYVAQTCNDQARGVNAPIAVGTSPSCTGGYPGLFDMSGNVVEWTDGCDGTAGAADGCLIRGGAYDDDGPSGILECATISTNARQSVDATKGFRCCQ
jgi:formylglycine-generating enzyme required for sulfatase activity